MLTQYMDEIVGYYQFVFWHDRASVD